MNKLLLATTLVNTASCVLAVKGRVFGREITRIISREIYKQQRKKIESNSDSVLQTFFSEQIDHVLKEINKLTSFQPDVLLTSLFDMKEWNEELINRVLPVLSKGMAESAKAMLLSIGANVKSTASDWLRESGLESPPGIATEFPAWMKREIGKRLKETFDQDYWQKINQSTRDDILQILTNGLQEGWSIRSMTNEIESKFGDEYSKERAKKVAITESGNALNSARDMDIQQLKEEMGEAGQYVGKSWLTVLDDRTRDAHADMDGALADSEGMFDYAGERGGSYRIPWPGYYGLPPEDRCNCRCSLISEFGFGAPEEELQEIAQRLAYE